MGVMVSLKMTIFNTIVLVAVTAQYLYCNIYKLDLNIFQC